MTSMRGDPPDDAAPDEGGTRSSAKEIHENIVKDARKEMDRPASELAYSALASGLLVSFSFLAVAFLADLMPDRLHRLAAAIVYPIGFIFVILARHQLFTENTLEPVLPLLEERSADRLKRLLRLWGIVLPFNLLGALIFAIAVAHTQAVPAEMHASMARVATESTQGGFLVVFEQGIWAGWLIALAAWLIAATHETTAQIVLVWLATAPIAAFGFRHSIAGAVEAFYRAAIGQASWGNMLVDFEIPAILGNIVGGIVLVALVNHGQTSGRAKAPISRPSEPRGG